MFGDKLGVRGDQLLGWLGIGILEKKYNQHGPEGLSLWVPVLFLVVLITSAYDQRKNTQKKL